MKTKPSKFVEVMQLILAYSVSCTEEHIILNQLTFAAFLGVSPRTIVRHFNTAKALNFIKVIDTIRIYNKHTKNNWLSNIYLVDNEKINQYIENEIGIDLLDNADNLINLVILSYIFFPIFIINHSSLLAFLMFKSHFFFMLLF